MTRAILIAAAASLALAACGDAEAPAPGEQQENRDARGEVLEGSISDAMLPLDSVTSQSPPQGGGDEAGDGGTDTESSASPPEGESASAPEP